MINEAINTQLDETLELLEDWRKADMPDDGREEIFDALFTVFEDITVQNMQGRELNKRKIYTKIEDLLTVLRNKKETH